MTASSALPLFDLLQSARMARGQDSSSAPDDRLTGIAGRLVESALDEYRRLCDLDAALAPDETHPFDRHTAVLIRHLYEQWAGHGEALLRRVSAERQRGRAIKGAGELADAVGRTRAMLSVTLEDLDRAEAQLRRGEAKPIEEVRRELRARSRA